MYCQNCHILADYLLENNVKALPFKINDIVYDKYGNPYTDAEEINRRLYVAASRCKNKLYLKYGK